MNAQEYMAEQVEKMGPILAHYIATTAPDKLNWQPSVEGSAPTRSVLEQIGECIAVNRFMAAMLRGEDVKPPVGGWQVPNFADAQDAQNQLIDSTTQLADAIRKMNDDDLSRTFQMRRGPTSGKNLMMMAYRNMAYHGGQINFIQLLTGDEEFHMPPQWY